MKYLVLFLITVFPCLGFSQTKKSKPRAPKQEIHQFYSNLNLSPDSAATPYLFYQVHDWIGTRYKFAGRTKSGIDCSGFVATMYKNAYCVQLSGGSRDLWPAVQPVEKADLKEGDILFFKIKKGQISHVGVYLGNNKFAHASVHSGVIVSDLNEDYYKKYFFKGGRIN